MNRFKKAIIAFSLILFFIVFLLISNQGEKWLTKTIDLPSKTDSQSGVSFEVTPLNFNFNNPIKFEIKIDTHSGSLNFDLENISILEDNKDNRYQPQGWQGSPPGGHHRSGILIFPKLENEAKKIKLTIQDIRPRIFEWNLE